MLDRDRELEIILDHILRIAKGDLEYRGEATGDDHLDALTMGLNMLTEELVHRESVKDELAGNLGESERIVEVLVNSVEESIALISTQDFTVRYCNRAYVERLYRKDGLNRMPDPLGRSLTELAGVIGYGPEKFNFFQEWIRETIVSRKGTKRLEEDTIEKDLRYYSSNLVPVVDGDHVSYLAYVARDITEEVYRSKEIEINASRLKKAQEIAKMGSWTFDLQSGRLHWSEQLYHIFELPIEEEPNYETFMSRIHPADRDEVQEAADNAIANGTGFELMHRIQTPTQKVKFLRCFGEAVVENGKVVQMMGVSADVTSTIEAARRIEQQKEALERANQRLQIANRRLEELAYVGSHDLKAPLLNFQGLLQLLSAEEEFSLNGRLLIEKLKLSAERMNETIMSLNDVLRHNQGKGDKPDLCSLSDITQMKMQELEIQLEESGAQIHVDFTHVDQVLFPRHRLESIVHNLLTNAIKYRKANVTPEISFTSSIIDDQVALSVNDNGVGIDLDLHGEKLFSLFRRFHDHVEGKGVGLHLIHNFIVDAGGRINVESEPGKGTRFVLTFGPSSMAYVEAPADR